MGMGTDCVDCGQNRIIEDELLCRHWAWCEKCRSDELRRIQVSKDKDIAERWVRIAEGETLCWCPFDSLHVTDEVEG